MNQPTQEKPPRNQFHPAFCDAMEQTFADEPGTYRYERELVLNSMPNRIDLLIVRQNATKSSRHGMEDIFRTYNIFEYKSPRQKLGVEEYYRTNSYAYLFAAHGNHVRMDDITISFVREEKPLKLLRYFREEMFSVTKYRPGIYHIRKTGHCDMQIIVTKALDPEYLWLKALTYNLTQEQVGQLSRAVSQVTAQENNAPERQRIRSILDLVSRINQHAQWEEETAMNGIRDLFKDEFDAKDQQIRERDEQLQAKDEQISRLTQEVEQLKQLIHNSKIAMF